MIHNLYTPLPYTVTPARGQALLNFQGRRMPEHLPLFEVVKIEEVNPTQATTPATGQNLLLHGDCLSACAYLKNQNIKVDLVYIDPPFASGANYAKKIFLRNGGESALESDDTPIGEEIMYGDIWQKEDYLNWLYERLLAIREVMSEEATIFVHLDWHIGHYVKLLLDEIFGEFNFINEIIWQRKQAAAWLSNQFGVVNDSIYWYSVGEDYNFNPEYSKDDPDTQKYIKERFIFDDGDGRKYMKSPLVNPLYRPNLQYEFHGVKPPPTGWLYSKARMEELYAKNELVMPKNGEGRIYRKIYEDTYPGQVIQNLWTDIPIVNPMADERADYATQKPEALLKRIIKAASTAGMTIADFFCGSGPTAAAALGMDCRFVACDVGLNAIQTTRDRLKAAGASFDILKIQDGVRLFRNPAQTTARIFSLVEGFKKREELELGEFWDGGIPGASGRYVPLKFVGLHERLTPALLDVFLEEIYQLETDDRAEGVKILYAHRELTVDQGYLNKRLREAGKTELKVELVSLNDLLDRKAASLFAPDNAAVDVQSDGGEHEVTIKHYFSPYLKAKIDEFNAKKGRRNGGELLEENGNGGDHEEVNGKVAESAKPVVTFKPVTISETGLELLESIQFDTTLRSNGVWISNPDLEDKAGPKEKVKGRYRLPTDRFKIKFRNIAGDEFVMEFPQVPLSVPPSPKLKASKKPSAKQKKR